MTVSLTVFPELDVQISEPILDGFNLKGRSNLSSNCSKLHQHQRVNALFVVGSEGLDVLLSSCRNRKPPFRSESERC